MILVFHEGLVEKSLPEWSAEVLLPPRLVPQKLPFSVQAEREEKRSLTGQSGQVKLITLARSVVWPSWDPLLPAPCSGAAYASV